MNQHPDAALNLRRIVTMMASRYAGTNHGYINRNAALVEYRFSPVDGESLFWTAHIYGRQKHSVVRFYLYRRMGKGRWRSRILKSATGEILHAIDFKVAATAKLDELREFILTTATFAGEGRPFPNETPGGGSRKVVGKHSTDGTHNLIAEALEAAEQQADPALHAPIDTEHDARVRELRGVVMRRGQKGFRDTLLKAYDGKCAITGCAAISVLEAAHIVPYRGERTHRPDNGLLLRSDIHTLFDLGLLWVDPTTMRVEMAEQLLATEYMGLRGRTLRLPQDQGSRPHRDHLQHHADTAQRALGAHG